MTVKNSMKKSNALKIAHKYRKKGYNTSVYKKEKGYGVSVTRKK